MRPQAVRYGPDAAGNRVAGWAKSITTTTSAVTVWIIAVNPDFPLKSPVESETEGVAVWAYSPAFESRLSRAIIEIESGRFDSVETVDELLSYIDLQTDNH